MELKMAVAKRQRKRKVHENGTKENLRNGVRTSGEASSAPTPFLASPICIGQAQGEEIKHIKKEARWIETFSLGSATLMH